MAFEDLREYIQALENKGLLRRVAKEVDKDWEIAAVARRTFQTIPDSRRPALLFEHVKGHDMPVVAGAIGGSPSIYAMALGITADNMARQATDKWACAIEKPIPPEIVSTGPCKDNIVRGKDVDLFQLPTPMWTREHDAGYFLTAPSVVTQEPATGIYNLGTYRLQFKEKRKTGIHIGHHGVRNLDAYESRDLPTPIAVVLGSDPSIALVSVSGIPYGSDEYAVAGALRGKPVPLVRCETNSLLVPATAEIVIEGEIPPRYREPEGPFGEMMGYMCKRTYQPIVNVKCITYRNHPIFHAYVSQKAPSESGLMRSIGRSSALYNHLKNRLNLPIADVRFKESGGAAYFLVISIQKRYPGQVWEVLWGAWSLFPDLGEMTIIVDDDIDIRNDFELEWAVSNRVEPCEDMHIFPLQAKLGDNVRRTVIHPDLEGKEMEIQGEAENPPVPVYKRAPQVFSKVFIDATKKHLYPPLALPPQRDMDKVAAQWDEYGIG